MTAPGTHGPPKNKDRTPTRTPQSKPSGQEPRPETQQRRHHCKKRTTPHTPGDLPKPAPHGGRGPSKGAERSDAFPASSLTNPGEGTLSTSPTGEAWPEEEEEKEEEEEEEEDEEEDEQAGGDSARADMTNLDTNEESNKGRSD